MDGEGFGGDARWRCAAESLLRALLGGLCAEHVLGNAHPGKVDGRNQILKMILIASIDVRDIYVHVVMNSGDTRSGGAGARGTKRARTDDDQQPQQYKRDDNDGDNSQSRGRPQLLLNTDELRKRTGKKYCDESELVPLLLAHGLIRRVRTFAVEVRPLGGDSFDIRLDAKTPTVGEAKEQIERDEGTEPERQLLCRVQVSSDGSNVREFDQEPEELKESGMLLKEGDVIAMGVMPTPVKWREYLECVTVSEEGTLATQCTISGSLLHTAEALTEGRHYREIEIVKKGRRHPIVGWTCNHNIQPTGQFYRFWLKNHASWFLDAANGGVFCHAQLENTGGKRINEGDRMGILLDLDVGIIRFFKNGVEQGTGYSLGTVTGPMTLAMFLFEKGQVRLLPHAAWPAEYAP